MIDESPWTFRLPSDFFERFQRRSQHAPPPGYPRILLDRLPRPARLRAPGDRRRRAGRRPQRSERHQFDLRRRAGQRRGSLRHVRLAERRQDRRREGDPGAHLRADPQDRPARSGHALPHPARPRPAPGQVGQRRGEPGRPARLRQGPGRQIRQAQGRRGAGQGRCRRPGPPRLHRLARRRLLAEGRHQPGGRGENAGRQGDQGLRGRPRRRVLQRPARLLPLDQLRPAVLPRAAREQGGPRAADPQDPDRAGRQQPLQFRPGAARPRLGPQDRPAGRAAGLERRPLLQGRAGQFPLRLQRQGRPGRPQHQRDHPRDPARLRSPRRRRRSGSSTPGAKAGC